MRDKYDSLIVVFDFVIKLRELIPPLLRPFSYLLSNNIICI